MDGIHLDIIGGNYEDIGSVDHLDVRFGPFDITAFAVESRLRPGTFATENVFLLKICI